MSHMRRYKLEMALCLIDRMVELLKNDVELEAFVFNHLISVKVELDRQLTELN